ncbi:hypothetical protein BDW67DRAFT_168853 [Aspergillus spinulosporus]
MKLQKTLIVVFLASNRLFLGTIAQECVFSDPDDTYFYTVDDVSEAFNGCTTIVAEIVNFSPIYDAIYLPGVTNITGMISVSHWKPGQPNGYPIMPVIEMPDLEYLGALDIRNVTALQNLTMPRLKETAGKIYIDGSYDQLRLDLRSLEITPSIWVNGQLNETRFDSLKRVDNDMVIASCAACRPGWSSIAPGQIPQKGLVLAFPGLVSVGYIKISGYLGSIAVPNLVSAGLPKNPGDGELSTDSGIRFHLTQVIERFDLNLPSLESVQKQLYIWGEMESLNIPALRTASASIHIDASTPLDIDLPLESANSIELLGRITSVHLPNLSPNTSLTLSSAYNCNSSSPFTNVTCSIPSSGLSKGTKIRVGVGVAVGVAVVICIALFCFKRARRKKMERREMPGSDLPAYSSRRGTEIGSGSGYGNAVPLRPETPPPPYSARPT